MIGKACLAALSLLLLLIIPSSLAQNGQVNVLTNEEFEVALNEEKKGAVTVPFNFTHTSNNVTVCLKYENQLSGIQYKDCFILEATVWIDDQLVLTRSFQEDAQAFTLSEEAFLLERPVHYGEVTLYGRGEGAIFYGTINLYIEPVEEPRNSWLPNFNWGFLNQDLLMLLLIFGAPTVVITALLIRRRRKET